MTLKASGQTGMALIEALVASAILGVGLLGATQLTLKTLQGARENRQHTVAQQLANEAMDCMQKPLALCAPQEERLIHGVRYTRLAHSTAQGDAFSRDLTVSVTWSGGHSPTSTSTSTSTSTATSSTAPNSNPTPAPQHRIEWHSRASSLPDWVGVSSP